jgi:adenylate cyclase
VDIELGVLFADARGFTALSESKPPQEVARLLSRFYVTAATVLYKHDAVIDKFVGDEVMALFLTGFTGPACFDKMATAAEGILRAVGYGSREVPWLPLGVGMDFGTAFVGNVGAGEVKDFTAIGDVVNTAARLQGEAKAGQIVMSERVYQEVRGRYPEALQVQLDLKGKSGPVAARVVEIVAAPARV